MSNQFYQIDEYNIPSKRGKTPKLLINYDKNYSSNISKRRIESANTNFTSKTHHNLIRQNKNFANQSNFTENYSETFNYPNPKPKKDLNYRPKWKYSYYLDKNDILSLNALKNNPEIKESLCDYKDIDKRPKPMVFSWTKPRMVKIIENNALIEEEVKSHFWKYSHLFDNNSLKYPGKLLRILMTQLSQGYNPGDNFMNLIRIGNFGEDRNLNNQLFLRDKWKVPGIYKNNRNNYEPIKIARPKSAYKY